MTTITKNSIVSRKKGVLFSRLDDELLGIDSQAGFCYSLNETGGRIWEMISAPISVLDICSQIRTEFEVNEYECQNEVIELLLKLMKSDLIQVHNPNNVTL